MFDFKYFAPTKVLFGKNTESKVADLIKEFGGTKVLIHYGGGSVVRSGLLKRVKETLDSARLVKRKGIFMDVLSEMLKEEHLDGKVIVRSLYAEEPDKCLDLVR